MNQPIKEMMIKWNNRFPLDHWYRKKYNIAFNSPEHREVNQIDIYWEWLEESEFNKITLRQNLLIENKEDLNKGIYLRPQKNAEQLAESERELFDALDIEKIQI